MKVLIIGLGSIAKKHIKALLEINPNIKLWALRSILNSDNFQNVINVNSIAELPARPDFVIISNPTYKHIDAIKLALSFRCPLFIEKPIYHKLTDAIQLLKEINLAGIKTYIGCNLRFLSCIQFLKNYIKSNPNEQINEINVYCGSFLPEWRQRKDSYSFYADKGGGVHLDLIHEFDYLYWIFGTPNKIHSFKSSISSLNISSIDYANYLLSYSNFSANIVLNYFRRDTKRTCEIVFKDKTWLVNVMENKIIEGNKIIFEDLMRPIDTYLPQMKYFIDCIQQNSHPINSFEEALDVLKICLHDSTE